MIHNKVCVQCVNDKTVRGITFNEEGKCSFCSAYERYRPKIHDYDRMEKLFLKKLDKKGDYDYDAAVGFSGGKDSTYVLYKLVKEYKLKVKAYTLDNGFMSEEAKEKIDTLVKELGVEHEYVQCDMELLKKTYAYIVSRYLSPCIACSFLGYAVMIDYASKINAKVGIHGRTPYQMFRGIADGKDDVFKPFIESGLSEEEIDVDALYDDVISKMYSLVDKKLAEEIKEKLLVDVKEKGGREFLAYFLYHPYNQKAIVSFLKENTSWVPLSEEEHFDCKIHHGALYLKNLIARRSHLMPEYSVMVRENVLTREEAAEKMQEEIDEKIAKEELKELCRYAGISYSKVMLKAKIYSKRWW